MKTLDFVCCVSGVLVLLIPAKGLSCSFQFAGECYWLSTERKSNSEAKEICVSMNGKLAQLHNQEVFKTITNMIASSSEEYWVGLTRDNKTFRWDNRAVPKESNWVPNEPNYTGNCVRLCRRYHSQTWGEFKTHLLADQSCSYTYRFICQTRQELGNIAVSKGTQKDAYENKNCPFTSFSFADSRLKCAIICILDPKCEGFVYDKTMSKCTMFTKHENSLDDMRGVMVIVLERLFS